MNRALGKSKAELLRELEDVQSQLAEARETLRAIREGEVDAIVVSGSRGELVFSLAGAESVYRLIVETMKEAALTVTLNGTVLFCNAQFAEFVKTRAEQIVGHALIDFVANESRSSAEDLLATSQHQPVKTRLVFEDAGGTSFPAHVSSHAINLPDGLSICLVVTDLTQLENSTAMLEQLRVQQEALREANDRLTEEDKRKDEFLAMLAHELRNPLAAISSAIELMGFASPDAPSRIETARLVAERQAGHMARLLNDLLDVSRVTTGKIRLQKTQIAVNAAMEDAVAAAGPLIATKGHRLYLTLAAESLFLEADPLRLTQVFSNILNNAAKYTPAGGEICLTATRDGRDAVIRVQDSGVGMIPELLPRIFDLFVQAERSPDREQGGLGIGLTMARSLVELHGGSIKASSGGPGKGSEFTVRLPLVEEKAKAGPLSSSPGEPFVRHSVMVVDDNADMVEMMAALLKIEGHEVSTALGGAAALDLALRKPPDVAFVDIGMPGMDGFELARRMQTIPLLARTKLVAISGYGQEEDFLKSRGAGFFHHLVKPVDLEALRRVLRDIKHS